MLVTLLCGVVVLAIGAPAAQARVSVGDVQIAETDGDTTATFTVTRRAGILSGGTAVHFSTADGSAQAPADYGAVAGDLQFGSLPLGGTQAQSVAVTVKGDRLDELSETFRLVLSGPEIADGEGVATIADDDPPPVVGVSDAPAAVEGATATFTISLSAPSGREVSLGFATANGSAVAGQDYTARSGTVGIPAGATSASLGVALLDDAADEPAESFELRISSPSAATLGDAAGRATIADNDEAPSSSPASPGPAAGGAPGSGSAGPGPSAGAPGAAPPLGTSASPRLGLSSPRLRRPSIVLVTVSCPRQTSSCRGRVTIFSRPNRRSKIKALRRERRLGQRNFTLASGESRTLTMALSRTDRVLLKRTGRMLVRAYAVTRDGAGRSAVRRTTGTLIARTTHS